MAAHPALREFSPEVERITKELGDMPLSLPIGDGLWWPLCESPHWTHIHHDACAICKAGDAPYALRLVIERVLALAEAGEVKSAPTPTDEQVTCRHCAKCGHWRSDHTNMQSRPRPCHHDDGCAKFVEPKKPCDFCRAVFDGPEALASLPNWPEGVAR